MKFAAFVVMTLLLTRCQPEPPKPPTPQSHTVKLEYDSTYQRLIPHLKRGDKISFSNLPQGTTITWNSDTSPCKSAGDVCEIRDDASKIYSFKCTPSDKVRCDPQVGVDDDKQDTTLTAAALPPPKDGSRVVPINIVVEISCKSDKISVDPIDAVNLNAPNQALVWNAPRQDVSGWSIVFVPQDQGGTPDQEQQKICTTAGPIYDQDTHRGCYVPQPAKQAKYYVKAGNSAGNLCKTDSDATLVPVQ
jgi:hypothetical protein